MEEYIDLPTNQWFVEQLDKGKKDDSLNMGELIHKYLENHSKQEKLDVRLINHSHFINDINNLYEISSKKQTQYHAFYDKNIVKIVQLYKDSNNNGIYSGLEYKIKDDEIKRIKFDISMDNFKEDEKYRNVDATMQINEKIFRIKTQDLELSKIMMRYLDRFSYLDSSLFAIYFDNYFKSEEIDKSKYKYELEIVDVNKNSNKAPIIT